MSAPDVATEIVADVAEEVAEQATHIAEVSRGLSGRQLGWGLGGLIVGAGIGVTVGYIFAQRRLEEKYNQIAAEEIAEMRSHYYAKAVARENNDEKKELEEIVKEKGYITGEATPPMAVTPPTAVTERAQEIADAEDAAASEPPTPEAEEPPQVEVRNIWANRDDEPTHEWDWHKERAQRSPLKPYVIHIDEREDQDAYEDVTYTYYEEDDVVCNERDDVLDAEERERIIGEANLDRFGHGSGSSSVVYVRNDKLEMDIEVIQSPNSYLEEVQGIPYEPEIKHADRRRERRSIEDE